jgi:hypothetical protein
VPQMSQGEIELAYARRGLEQQRREAEQRSELERAEAELAAGIQPAPAPTHESRSIWDMKF